MSVKNLYYLTFNLYFCFTHSDICVKFAFLIKLDPWCNGNTPVFGTGIQGSSPCGSTILNQVFITLCVIKAFFILKEGHIWGHHVPSVPLRFTQDVTESFVPSAEKRGTTTTSCLCALRLPSFDASSMSQYA